MGNCLSSAAFDIAKAIWHNGVANKSKAMMEKSKSVKSVERT